MSTLVSPGSTNGIADDSPPWLTKASAIQTPFDR
jgi:hypothetical protein